jgi:hypothetical protein
MNSSNPTRSSIARKPRARISPFGSCTWKTFVIPPSVLSLSPAANWIGPVYGFGVGSGRVGTMKAGAIGAAHQTQAVSDGWAGPPHRGQRRYPTEPKARRDISGANHARSHDWWRNRPSWSGESHGES